jgi:hypothetical protein
VVGAIQRLPPLQVAHPVQVAIAALAIKNLLIRQVAITFIYKGLVNWAFKEEKPIL